MLKTILSFVLLAYFNLSLFAQQVPYRAEETYKLELDLKFKTSEPPDFNTVNPGVLNRNNNIGLQLYVNVKLSILYVLPEDYKLKVINNKKVMVLSKKLKRPDEFVIKLGKAQDMKEGKAPNLYEVLFIGTNKTTQSRITIEIQENGDFLVNNQLFGKF